MYTRPLLKAFVANGSQIELETHYDGLVRYGIHSFEADESLIRATIDWEAKKHFKDEKMTKWTWRIQKRGVFSFVKDVLREFKINRVIVLNLRSAFEMKINGHKRLKFETDQGEKGIIFSTDDPSLLKLQNSDLIDPALQAK